MNNETITTERKRTPPLWFGKALGAAQHQCNLARAKWWQRLFHRVFVAWRCPCCLYTKRGGPMNINLVVLSGHMTRDCEQRYTPKGTAVGEFGLAVNRTWKSEDGTKNEEVSFFDCVAFGRTAEVIAEFLKKGSPIMVEARAKQETWTDKNDGRSRSKVKFIVERFHFVPVGGGKGKAADEESPRPGKPPPPGVATEAAPVAEAEDDVPF